MAVINLIKKKGINPQTKTTLYFPQWTRRSTDTAMELAAEMDGSTYSQGEVVGVLTDFPKRILRSLMNGNAAKIPGLGTFKLRVQGKAKENIDDVTAQGCRAQVVFDVDPKLAAELADAKFAFVTRPTSEGEQDVVDDETPTDNTDTNNQGGEGGGDNNGGGNGGLE
jgi:predicted histone-like DNA-binding protein